MIEDRFCHYKTGNAAIDAEHLVLMKMCDTVLTLCRTRPPDIDKMKQVLTEIGVKLAEHFEHEERMMLESNFKYIKFHCEAHNDLRKKFNDMLRHEFTCVHINKIANDLEFIFFNHIDNFDMQAKLNVG